MATGSTEAQIAHVLRRTTFGPLPGQVAALVPGGVAAAIDSVLAQPPVKYKASGSYTKADASHLAQVWLARMVNKKAGLHEKMVWFWHGHFTSGAIKVNSAGYMAQQHNLLRLHALGDFREFAYQVTIDPAMLVYLDGAGSTGDEPNENYSREFMELFTISRAFVTQADVVAGAKALSGWRISGKTAVFDPSQAYGSPVTYLGHSVTNARDVVNAAVDHPNCSKFIASKLYRYLAGVDPTTSVLNQLASTFVSANLNIRTLVEAIVRDPAFLDMRLNRPRFPVEWVSAARAAAGLNSPKDALQVTTDMGQIPFEPPNVAGWGPGPRWLSSSQALARVAFSVNTKSARGISSAADPVAATLAYCSLYEVSDATRGALDDVAVAIGNKTQRAMNLLALALASPEFALA